MTENGSSHAQSIVRSAFNQGGIDLRDLTVREFPGEVILVAHVHPDDVSRAAVLANVIDRDLEAASIRGFVTVRGLEDELSLPTGALRHGVHDDRVSRLVTLLAARSRASEIQPSLHYVQNAAVTIESVTSTRHHLIFGRRGAGKTALMVEAKRRLDRRGDVTVWINVQTYRRESPERVVLFTLLDVFDGLMGVYADKPKLPSALADLSKLREQASQLLGEEQIAPGRVEKLVPWANRAIKAASSLAGTGLFVFLDDFHYLPRSRQAEVLDVLHGCMRDANGWLKVAAIQHLTRWFDSEGSVGLQTGHDARVLDLDVSLQDPALAKAFLENVLVSYCSGIGIASLGAVFSKGALDRLVLASGAVPRDYLVLASEAISGAIARPNSDRVGKQDVTQAAGRQAATKVQEMEDDLATERDAAQAVLSALQSLRLFCLEERKYTFFSIDFRDREDHPMEYALLEELMDVRLIHLLNPSVSDEHQAGERSEVYLLDLSQYSGQRLKKFIRVLDFVDGNFALRETGRKGSTRAATTARSLLTLLRRGPQFELSRLSRLSLGSAE